MDPNVVKGLHSLPYAAFNQHLQGPSHNQRIKSTYIDPSENPTQTIPHSHSQSQLYFSGSQIPRPYAFSPNASSVSNDTICDEAEALQQSIVNERKLKRVISNRESARRSRMRKKQQIQVLQSHVDQLQFMNHQLSKKLIDLLDCNQQILQDNTLLKEKVSSLQLVISDLIAPPRSINQEFEGNPDCLMTEPLATPTHRTSRNLDLFSDIL